MSETNHIESTRTMSWLLAAAATCAFVFGMWPATLLASCMPDDEPSCCCSSSDGAQPGASDTHDCAESGCECHVAPDNPHTTPLDAVVDVAPSTIVVPLGAASDFTWPDIGEVEVDSAPVRGDPVAAAPPIYLQNQVLLL
ncbi:MAG: hypothetical protein ACQEVA_12645 [Myxococcota bacterium]